VSQVAVALAGRMAARARQPGDGRQGGAAGRPRARRALLATLFCSLSVLGPVLAPGPAGAVTTGSEPASTTTSTASSSGTTSSPTQSQINATEAQVATIEAQIAKQQDTLDQDDEQYNQAVVNLTATRSALRSTAASIAAVKSKLATERANLQSDAVQAYIDDTSSASVAQEFAAPSSESQIRDLYEKLGAGQVARAVARVQAGQKQLAATRAKLLSEQRSETAQVGEEDQARQSAAAASAQSEATLTQVQGALTQQIAQQEAAQAVAAAKAAAAATSPAAAQQAAAQASQAAQVAGTVSGGSAAADSAATAANQASSSAGGVTFGYAGTASAAGLAAVHGAMKYLGVPYEWGGASYSGVDCSGLTMLAWAQAGVSMDHSAADQYADFPHVSPTALEPGDLLFYDFGGDGIDHVVMYVGPVLDGQATPYGADTIIQAAHTGTVVEFDPVWSEGFVGAARP
jgi:cell wall-associated NlpC family hydrolase